jgi:hypothetical protein
MTDQSIQLVHDFGAGAPCSAAFYLAGESAESEAEAYAIAEAKTFFPNRGLFMLIEATK